MPHESRFLRAYYGSNAVLRRSYSFAHACLTGMWLGVLSKDRRHAIDRIYYDGQAMYRTGEYNRRGFWDWEQRALDEHFAGCRRILVLAAGGGREVLALEQRRLDVTGFECHPELVSFANELLCQEGFAPRVYEGPRDACPSVDAQFDGAIVGWGAYMLVRGRERRIAMMRQLGACVPPGAPVLLSFFALSTVPRRFRTAARVGNAIGRLSGGERVEIGDYLVPNYVHYFTHAELDAELATAGFELLQFAVLPYGHAVARWRGPG